MRTSTLGGVNFDVLFDVIVCGEESIISLDSSLGPITGKFYLNTDSHIIDLSKIMQSLLSTEQRCPIFGYDIIDKDTK
jgi:hypothetical protein